MAADTQLCQMGAQHFVELQHRFAKAVMCDADAAQTDRLAQSATNRFGKGFLGSEAFR